MDKSWNFLVETQDRELSVLLQLFAESGFEGCTDASSIINGMKKDLSLNVVDYDYEQFLDRVCDIFSLNLPLNYTNKNNLKEKETLLLQCFLFIIVDNLSNSEIISFAKHYRFSNDKKESLKKEISTRIAVSENFKLILPYLVRNLSKPKEISLPTIVYGIPFHIIRPVLESSVIFISDSLNNDEHFKWIPIASTLIGMRQEYTRPFEVKTAKDYLDTIIRFNNAFTSQKYSTLSVMFSLYKSLHDGAELNDSLIEEMKSFLQQKEMAFRVQLFKKAKREIIDEDFKKAFKELIRFLMKRLLPCNDSEERVFRINDQSAGKGKTAFFYYKFPYSKPESFPNARYIIPDDEFEKKAVKLYLSCMDIDENKHLIAKGILLKEIEQNVTDWTIVIAAWDDENNYPKGVTIIKNDPLFDSLIEKYQYPKKHTIRVPIYSIELLTEFLRGSANVEDVETLLHSNLLGRTGYLVELLKTAMQMVSAKENYERSNTELGIKFRNLRHNTSIKIGRIRLKLDAIAKNEYDAKDIETIKNKLSEIETMLQSAGKDEDEVVDQLNLIDELNSHIQGWEDVFSVEKEYNNNEKLWIEFGKTEFSIVLDNIYKNIEAHAFPKMMLKKAKRVKVSIENLDNGNINVSISNNGIPFEGDPEKAFDYGQTYGINGNKGIGLHSVKELMRKHRGGAMIIPNPNKEFCVTVQLSFIGVNQK